MRRRNEIDRGRESLFAPSPSPPSTWRRFNKDPNGLSSRHREGSGPTRIILAVRENKTKVCNHPKMCAYMILLICCHNTVQVIIQINFNYIAYIINKYYLTLAYEESEKKHIFPSPSFQRERETARKKGAYIDR